MYIRIQLMLHLCRLLEELLMMVELCSTYFSFNLILKQKHMFNLPQGGQ